ncbi:MAG: transketolase [Candidatus Alcyoniella australis]|nr:transketolase [Candidatus Alcyoniella australis]
MVLRIDQETDQLAVNTIKMLAVDAIEKAGSGHPGMPLGAADMAYVLWTRFLRFAPSDPQWVDRDRFVLSAGHASMLLYALLHLSGFKISLEDIKQFRQWGSQTPGHPELHLPGVECTTGPLGQGLGMAVGMALAGKRSAAEFNHGAFDPIGYRVFTIVSDGDLMEGVSAESASLAGHWGLDNLVALYDANQITIEGNLDLSHSEDVGKRFAAYGWKVLRCDGHDREALARTIKRAIKHQGAPCLVIARTHIGAGSPGKCDCEVCHGAPLGSEESACTKRCLGWPEQPTFLVPDQAREPFAKAARRGERTRRKHKRALAAWLAEHPQSAQRWDALMGCELPEDLFQRLTAACPDGDAATRGLSGKALAAASAAVPALIGGSADLGPSNKSTVAAEQSLSRDNMLGRNIHFGVREHAMGAIANGLALSGSAIPYTATFLVFSDYMRPSIRLAALMGIRTIFLFSHDSLMVGEDGPTHQPVEHVAALRLIPNLAVLRPADAAETAACWTAALARRDGPTALILSRQKLAQLEGRVPMSIELLARGGYVVSEALAAPRAVLLATGSEVALAFAARKALGEAGTGLRIVSVPWLERFAAQPPEYLNDVLPPDLPRVCIELGSAEPWYKLAGDRGLIISVDRFGASAPDKVIAEKFGFTPEQVAQRIRTHLG